MAGTYGNYLYWNIFTASRLNLIRVFLAQTGSFARILMEQLN